MSEQEPAVNMDKRELKTYQEARLQNTENLRKLVVDAAATILQEEGPEAVTVRKVSQKMGCSTKIIYSLFVNKEGLAQQLYLDGCKIMAREFEATPALADPREHLLALGETYWQFAQGHTSYYKLMFGGAFGDFKPDEESLQGTVTAMRQLIYVVGSAQQQGLLSAAAPTDTVEIVRLVWGALHGVIHLQMGGHFGDVPSAYATYQQTLSLLSSTLFAKQQG